MKQLKRSFIERSLTRNKCRDKSNCSLSECSASKISNEVLSRNNSKKRLKGKKKYIREKKIKNNISITPSSRHSSMFKKISLKVIMANRFLNNTGTIVKNRKKSIVDYQKSKLTRPKSAILLLKKDKDLQNQKRCDIIISKLSSTSGIINSGSRNTFSIKKVENQKSKEKLMTKINLYRPLSSFIRPSKKKFFEDKASMSILKTQIHRGGGKIDSTDGLQITFDLKKGMTIKGRVTLVKQTFPGTFKVLSDSANDLNFRIDLFFSAYRFNKDLPDKIYWKKEFNFFSLTGAERSFYFTFTPEESIKGELIIDFKGTISAVKKKYDPEVLKKLFDPNYLVKELLDKKIESENIMKRNKRKIRMSDSKTKFYYRAAKINQKNWRIKEAQIKKKQIIKNKKFLSQIKIYRHEIKELMVIL